MVDTHTATSWILNLIEVGLNSGLLRLCSHFCGRENWGKEGYRGGDDCVTTSVFDWHSSVVECWNNTHPAAQWALHQEVLVSGVELKCPRGLKIGLEKPLAECSHWEKAWKVSWTPKHDDKWFSTVRSKETHLQLSWWAWSNNHQGGAPLRPGPGQAQCWSPSDLLLLWGYTC